MIKFEDSAVPFEKTINGYYRVGEKFFYKNFNAILESNITKLPISWDFHRSKFTSSINNRNLNLNSAYVAQNIRIYYPALLNLPYNEMVMITDMDMLPCNGSYYKNGLDNYTTKDFIYYRHIDGNQIYMCYNAAHPTTWSSVFNIKNISDIETMVEKTYKANYSGIPGSSGWFIDQEIMYKKLINYNNLKVLNRPIKRLEVSMYKMHLARNDVNFISRYDDVHFHRDFFANETLINHAEKSFI